MLFDESPQLSCLFQSSNWIASQLPVPLFHRLGIIIADGSGAAYALQGYSASDVGAIDAQTLQSDPEVVITNAGMPSFKLHFSATHLGFENNIYGTTSGDVSLIWAYGQSWTASGEKGLTSKSFDRHTASSGSTSFVNFQSGEIQQVLPKEVLTHGKLMLRAPLTLAATPLLSLAMKFSKRWRRVAFYAHSLLASAGLTLGLIRVLLLALVKQSHFTTSHSNAGRIVLIIIGRPKRPEAALRAA